MPGNKRSAPVANVVCPVTGCGQRVPVFRYEARAKDDKGLVIETRRRFAGKLYCRCPTDGKMDCNEYILNSESLEWLNDERKQNAPPVETPEKIESAPVLPTTKPPVPPVNKQQQKPQSKGLTGWGWF